MPYFLTCVSFFICWLQYSWEFSCNGPVFFALHHTISHTQSRLFNMEYANGLFASFSVSFTISISLARSFFLLVLSDFSVSAKKNNTRMKQEQIFLNIIQFMILTNAMANSNIFKLNFFSSSLVNFTYLGFFALIFQCDRMLKPFGFMLYWYWNGRNSFLRHIYVYKVYFNIILL